MDLLDFVQKHWSIFMTFAGAIWAFFWLSLNSKYVAKNDYKKEVDGLHQIVRSAELRLTTVEQIVKYLPTAKEITELRLVIEKISGEYNHLNQTIKSLEGHVNQLLSRIGGK